MPVLLLACAGMAAAQAQPSPEPVILTDPVPLRRVDGRIGSRCHNMRCMLNSPMPKTGAGRARWLAVAAVALGGTTMAGAQERPLEIGGTVGWTLSDGVKRTGGIVGTSGLFATGITPADGISYAFFAGYFLNENVQLGFQLRLGRADLGRGRDGDLLRLVAEDAECRARPGHLPPPPAGRP